ncbi:MAG: triphosphoribosyl-dephospho-CoA synthase, partial [Clostridia bacterium]|nr:triphosphoribosyl-dephospho-CoA synthase [Clostridia bacterium]
TSKFPTQQARKLSTLSMQALLYEVSVTPKPGLVDRNNTGAHKDIDIFTFEASAVSLNHYFEQFALCGIENGHEPFSRIFSRLRSLGIQAEKTMLRATNQVNTHKGLIFSLAIMNGSLGYMYANHIPYSGDALLEINRKLVADVLDDFNDVTIENAHTNGERLYALYGMKGARGEALSGYHTVLKEALPVLKHQLDRGLSLNDAGAVTLLYIMAHSEDTNIVNRSSYESMKNIQARLREKLSNPEFITGDPIPYMEALDREFITYNISPPPPPAGGGGAAPTCWPLPSLFICMKTQNFLLYDRPRNPRL